jgi:hypothetical protein
LVYVFFHCHFPQKAFRAYPIRKAVYITVQVILNVRGIVTGTIPHGVAFAHFHHLLLAVIGIPSHCQPTRSCKNYGTQTDLSGTVRTQLPLAQKTPSHGSGAVDTTALLLRGPRQWSGFFPIFALRHSGQAHIAFSPFGFTRWSVVVVMSSLQ